MTITIIYMRNSIKHILGLLIISIAISLTGYGASIPQLPEPGLSWKNITVDNKKTAVFSIFKDSRDLIWLGTNSGLYLYDGISAHLIAASELIGTHIYSIVEKDNKLFLGSNNGLIIYDYQSGIAKECISPTPKEIRALLLTDNDLWIGSLNGIYKFNLNSYKIDDCTKGLPHKSVYSILRDSRGIIYVGTYNGIARWDSKSSSFKALKIKLDNTYQSSLFANCILESEDKEHIYFGGEGYLYKYTPSDNHWDKITLVENNNIKSLSNGDNGHILIGTDNGVFDLLGNNIKHYRHDSRQELSLADNEIWCIYADNQHNIWAGHERGFSIASNSKSLKTIKLSDLAHSGEGNEIHSIHRDSKNNLWFGGTNGLIRLSENSQTQWYRHSKIPGSLSHNRIRAIYEDKKGSMWFATDGGINRYNPSNNLFDVFHVVDSNAKHNSNWVYALAEDKGYFWIGSFLNGLHYVDKNKFNSNGGTIVSDIAINTETQNIFGLSLANNLVNDIIKDNCGNLWILLFRDNNITKYSPASRKMVKYDIFELTGEYPTNICTDIKGRVWCAYRGGVIIFDNNGYKNIKFPHTNSDETTLAIGKVGNNMWISTLSNIWRIDGNSLKASLLPIPQKAYTAIYEDKITNKIYLGGTDEILEINGDLSDSNLDYKSPKLILDNLDKEHLSISDFGDKKRELRIPYGGGFSIVVSTLNYSPEAIQRYMYKLAGSPNDTTDGWIVMPEGSNTITFSDLTMGNYTILVKAVGSTAAPISIPLIVNPPIFLSWWAIIIYILLALAAIYWIIWYTKRKNLRAFQEQERERALENVEKKLSFLTSISHDLKTPLSMILGPASLMKERAKDAESKKNLETIYSNAVRLNNMIHRTLELQHLEDSDENLLILSVFDVVDFCKGVFEAFKENNPQKNFIFHASSQKLFIEADAVKFESVITNLLSNACKYSDEGATISLGISKRDDNVEIVVSDDGVGISDIDQPLVFQRMFRAPATSKLKEGTGLGLYLIKKYLELMQGNINLYSKEGQGTSFVATLPISEKVITEKHSENSTENSNRPKILIVEDNLQISNFIKEILKDDFTVLSAENGRSGLAIAASFSPDLIIIDEMMPIMNGLEMAKIMKQNPRLASIPTIMLTAKSDITTENESIKLGIDVFMTKPFEPAALLGRIKQLLKGRTEIKERVRIQAIAEAQSKPIEAESINEKALAKIAKTIEENISDPDLNVNFLCEKSGIPNKQLYRLIKKYMNIAPLDYIRSVRLQKAAMLLSQHRFTVAEISYMVGFKTPSYFAKCFQNHFGVKPSQYQSDDETLEKKQDN